MYPSPIAESPAAAIDTAQIRIDLLRLGRGLVAMADNPSEPREHQRQLASARLTLRQTWDHIEAYCDEVAMCPQDTTAVETLGMLSDLHSETEAAYDRAVTVGFRWDPPASNAGRCPTCGGPSYGTLDQRCEHL